jgi:hypothetical protein
VLACLCGLCAALLMALQETHLYVLNPGSWMLEAWCRRCALRVGASGVAQVWCLAVTVPVSCVVPLPVLLPPAGAGAGRAVAVFARSAAFFTLRALALVCICILSGRLCAGFALCAVCAVCIRSRVVP